MLNLTLLPNVSKYMGVFKLKVGIYINCFLRVIICIASVTVQVLIIQNILTLRKNVISLIDETDPEFGSNITNDYNQDETIFTLGQIIICFLGAWVLMKIMYFIANVCVIYGVKKRKPVFLKIYMYACVPCWVFDTVPYIATILFNSNVITKITIVVIVLCESYNILAIRSYYNKMTRKLINSNPVNANSLSSGSSANVSVTELDSPSLQSGRVHCRTCTCRDPSITETPTASETNNSVTPPDYTEPKLLNFKDQYVIYDPTQLSVGGSSVVSQTSQDSDSSVRAVRPSTLALKSPDLDKLETIVIYDEDQLNMGLSPVIEHDRVK